MDQKITEYTRIVKGLETELKESNAKITALEQENYRLKELSVGCMDYWRKQLREMAVSMDHNVNIINNNVRLPNTQPDLPQPRSSDSTSSKQNKQIDVELIHKFMCANMPQNCTVYNNIPDAKLNPRVLKEKILDKLNWVHGPINTAWNSSNKSLNKYLDNPVGNDIVKHFCELVV